MLGALLIAPVAGAAALRAAPRLIGRGVVGTGRAAFRTPRRAIATLVGVPSAVGLLVSSPIARRTAREALDPRASFRRGKGLGGIIEGGLPTLPRTPLAGLRTAGLAGAALGVGGLAVAGGAALARGVQRRRQQLQQLQAGVALPAGVLPAQQAIVGQIPTRPVEEEEPKELKATAPTVKITNKPEVNILLQNAIS